MFFNKQLDILSIGDTTVDSFIRLKDANTHCNIKNDQCELCVRFGAKIPYESLTNIPASGNSANVAIGASRLGLRTGLISAVGNDYYGKECLKALRRNKISTNFVEIQKNTETNCNFVLWYGVERTILVKHHNFSYKWPKMNQPKWIYLSSLGETPISYYEEIFSYLRKNPEVKLAFQPGTFQIKLGYEKLKEIYRRTDVLICNKSEAQKILRNHGDYMAKILQDLKNLGPKIVVVTDDIKGAYATDGERNIFMPIYPGEPFERTGAGDAFSSAFISALIYGKSLEEALRWGPVNSASVIKYVGAQKGLLTRKQIEERLKQAPHNYNPRIIK